MLYELLLKFHQDPLISCRAIGHYSTPYKFYGCRKLQTLQITELLVLILSTNQFQIKVANIHLLLSDRLRDLVILARGSYKYFKICCNVVTF